jgi:hypothetical protein
MPDSTTVIVDNADSRIVYSGGLANASVGRTDSYLGTSQSFDIGAEKQELSFDFNGKSLISASAIMAD